MVCRLLSAKPLPELILTHFWLGAGEQLGPVSISEKTSFRKISWSIEATRLVLWIVVSLWNLPGTSAGMQPVEFQNDQTMLNTNLAASRLYEISRKDVFSDIETGPRFQWNWKQHRTDFLIQNNQSENVVMKNGGHFVIELQCQGVTMGVKFTMGVIHCWRCSAPHCVNALWPNYAIWRHRIWSTLAK